MRIYPSKIGRPYIGRPQWAEAPGIVIPGLGRWGGEALVPLPELGAFISAIDSLCGQLKALAAKAARAESALAELAAAEAAIRSIEAAKPALIGAGLWDQAIKAANDRLAAAQRAVEGLTA